MQHHPLSRRIALGAVLAVALTAGCRRHRNVVQSTTAARHDTAGTVAAGPPAPGSLPGSPQGSSQASLQPFLPNPARTPGDTLAVTAQDICMPGYAKRIRAVPSSVKRRVYATYDITAHEPGEYEVDHLISLELGGSNSTRNLWPESYRTQPWNARVKDVLENELHRQVCAGKLPLHVAQQAIAQNWIAAYRQYMHRTLPTTGG